ncbi:hypothetical protein [Rhizobium laguerreae]|nr:hypothetical protein [Rhizobium laguerreae]
MSGIKLSICIPTYNREAYLRNSLNLPNLVFREHDVARHIIM